MRLKSVVVVVVIIVLSKSWIVVESLPKQALQRLRTLESSLALGKHVPNLVEYELVVYATRRIGQIKRLFEKSSNQMF